MTAFFTYITYVLYLRYRIRPLSDSGHMTPEDRLEIGLIASTLIPVSTLIYGEFLWMSSGMEWPKG